TSGWAALRWSAYIGGPSCRLHSALPGGRIASERTAPLASPAMGELLGPAEEPVDGELASLDADASAPAPERADAGGRDDAEVQARRVGRERLEHEGDRARVLGDDAPRLPPLDRGVIPAQTLHPLVEAPVREAAVLVRAGAGRPAGSEVHAEEAVAAAAGRDAPVPERAIGPEAAAPVLHGEAAERIEPVAAVARAHLALAGE